MISIRLGVFENGDTQNLQSLQGDRRAVVGVARMSAFSWKVEIRLASPAVGNLQVKANSRWQVFPADMGQGKSAVEESNKFFRVIAVIQTLSPFHPTPRRMDIFFKERVLSVCGHDGLLLTTPLSAGLYETDSTLPRNACQKWPV